METKKFYFIKLQNKWYCDVPDWDGHDIEELEWAEQGFNLCEELAEGDESMIIEISDKQLSDSIYLAQWYSTDYCAIYECPHHIFDCIFLDAGCKNIIGDYFPNTLYIRRIK